MSFCFSLYGGDLRPITLRQLLELPRGELLARAEYSGSEGCYVEIARWNERTHRWERYAFDKFFGGELRDDWGDAATAAHVAAIINRRHRSTHDRFIACLPNFSATPHETPLTSPA